ncbi:MAG: hypothetical protein WA966_08810 [Ornithinimicrobium sp.]
MDDCNWALLMQRAIDRTAALLDRASASTVERGVVRAALDDNCYRVAEVEDCEEFAQRYATVFSRADLSAWTRDLAAGVRPRVPGGSLTPAHRY